MSKYHGVLRHNICCLMVAKLLLFYRNRAAGEVMSTRVLF